MLCKIAIGVQSLLSSRISSCEACYKRASRSAWPSAAGLEQAVAQIHPTTAPEVSKGLRPLRAQAELAQEALPTCAWAAPVKTHKAQNDN